MDMIVNTSTIMPEQGGLTHAKRKVYNHARAGHDPSRAEFGRLERRSAVTRTGYDRQARDTADRPYRDGARPRLFLGAIVKAGTICHGGEEG